MSKDIKIGDKVFLDENIQCLVGLVYTEDFNNIVIGVTEISSKEEEVERVWYFYPKSFRYGKVKYKNKCKEQDVWLLNSRMALTDFTLTKCNKIVKYIKDSFVQVNASCVIINKFTTKIVIERDK